MYKSGQIHLYLILTASVSRRFGEFYDDFPSLVCPWSRVHCLSVQVYGGEGCILHVQPEGPSDSYCKLRSRFNGRIGMESPDKAKVAVGTSASMARLCLRLFVRQSVRAS
jgi:hypothetical protein